jgi:hypothetical protein
VQRLGSQAPISIALPLGGASSSKFAQITDAESSSTRLTYHGGRLLIHHPVAIYYIYYGDWTVSQRNLVYQFTTGLVLSDWWSTSLKYYQQNAETNNQRAYVSGDIMYGKQLNDEMQSVGTNWDYTTPGKLLNNIWAQNILPQDTNGIYYILTKGVNIHDYCDHFCGYHSSMMMPNGQPVAYAVTPVPQIT